MTSRRKHASTLIRCVTLVSCLSASSPGLAQVTLPGARVDLPHVGLGVPGVPDASVSANAAAVRIDARRLRVRDLLRSQPDRLTTDPGGEPVVRDELLAQPSTAEVARRWEEAGYTVRSKRDVVELGLVLYVLQPPRNLSLPKALRNLRQLDPGGSYDYQHVMTEGGDPVSDPRAAGTSSTSMAVPAADTNDTRSRTGPGSTSHSSDGASVLRVGMIDAGVDATHVATRGVDWRTRGCGGRFIPAPHGTAVASLLVAVLRDATIGDSSEIAVAAADVYCGDPVGATIASLIDALAWMVSGQVPVINVSLVGPRNALLERAVASVIARGHTIVAAVGNDGPAAPPLYPAAYEGVVGVTAVDRRGRVLLEAGRGKSVDFAALGLDLEAAAPSGGFAAVRGTSFASPQVAALLAARRPRIDPGAARRALDELAASAVDLGAPGRDDVYGLGWVRSPATDMRDFHSAGKKPPLPIVDLVEARGISPRHE